MHGQYMIYPLKSISIAYASKTRYKNTKYNMFSFHFWFLQLFLPCSFSRLLHNMIDRSFVWCSRVRNQKILRRFYTRRNVSGMSRRHRFFLLLHMRKTFVYFLEMSIPPKSRNHFNFSTPNKVAFFLNQSFCVFM